MHESKSDDPISAIASTMRRDRPWIAVTMVAAAVTHAAVALTFPRTVVRRAVAPPPDEVIDIEVPKPPPTSEPETKTPPKPATPKDAPAPLAPAQAAQVLTQEADPTEPVDLTNTFTVGDGSTYGGGTTSSTGTSRFAVVAPIQRPSKLPSSEPAPPPPPTPDRSRRPTLAGGHQWDCPFPAEADTDGIDSAVASIRVSVDASGHVTSVAVTSDPGHGFGREARRCAYGKPWSAARDHDGRSIAGVAVISVRFVR
jgi:periplasmic protein TonB